MDRLVRFIQDKQVGTWCKVAAWIIAALGVVNIILGFSAFLSQGNGSPFTGLTTDQILYALFQTLRLTFSTAASTIFYFFVLYAAGALLEATLGSAKQAEMEEEEEEEEELDVNETLLPGQRLH